MAPRIDRDPASTTGRDPAVGDAFQIVSQIRRIVRAINLHSQELSRQAGLTVPQLVLLQHVHDSDEQRSTATALCRAMGVNPATMSGLVNRLVKRGYLARERSQRDRRVVELQLTASGRGVLADAPAPLQDAVLDRLGRLSPQERTRILAALDRVVELMEAEDLDASPILTPDASVDPS